MNCISRPSHLEIQVLRVLWLNGPSTASAVHDEMAGSKERAYTTVLTVLQNLEKKSLVQRVKIGRSHVYEPIFTAQKLLAEMMKDFVGNAYGGDWYEAGHQLLKLAKLSDEQRDELADSLLSKSKGLATRPAKKNAVKTVNKTAKKAAKKAGKKAANQRS